jgi:hypothetical protein
MKASISIHVAKPLSGGLIPVPHPEVCMTIEAEDMSDEQLGELTTRVTACAALIADRLGLAPSSVGPAEEPEQA